MKSVRGILCSEFCFKTELCTSEQLENHATGSANNFKYPPIAGWEEERSGPTGKSFRFFCACVRAVIVKWT